MWCLENLLFKNGNVCFLHFKESFRTKAESQDSNDKGMHKYLKYFTKFQSIIMIQKNILQKD